MFKKILSTILMLIVGFLWIAAISVNAEDLEEPLVEVNNQEDQTEINNLVSSTSESGDNLIESTTPTPIPQESPSPSPIPNVTNEIVTSDSISETEVTNNVNVNSVDSEIINHTLNIYLSNWVGDIDLSILTGKVINKVYQEDQKLDGEISLEVKTIDNFTYIENVINSVSNSGSNEIVSTDSSQITTGNAYSVVSVLNNVNVNIIDSKIHLVTINIFGEVTGNIILPNSQDSSCELCNQDIDSVSNTTTINNNVSSNSVSGENTISSEEDINLSQITTGDAKSVVNILNVVNNTYLDSSIDYLYINNQGEWVGEFLGWDQEITSSSPKTETSLIQASNTTTLNNLVTSTSNTGDNEIQSLESSQINTGNAYSSVSVVNLVNTNFINSKGFIGFINIFGRLIGNIGGANLIKAKDQEPQNEEKSEEKIINQEPDKKEEGGYLEVSHSNNVGTHVLPGDTVTFFVDIKNPGYGKVYETTLTIELFKNGISYGGFNYYVGDIFSQNTLKYVTGLVMSNDAEAGEYTAIVSIKGVVGPNNDEVSATSESKFKIVNKFTKTKIVSSVSAFEKDNVLGESNIVEDNSTFKISQIVWTFLFLLMVLIIAKIHQKRKIVKNMLI